MTDAGEYLVQEATFIGDGGGVTERSRVCTFHYQAGGGGSSRRNPAPQLLHQILQQPTQQQQQQLRQRFDSAALAMPSNREMPSYDEWKRRRANRPFGQEVVLLELDPKEELAKRKARDQRLMSLMKPEDQDGFYTYLDHYERVQAKVEQDRAARERQKVEAAKQASAQNEERKREEHRVRKRLDRVALTTDGEFTADVAKSKYYQLVRQEQRRDFKSREERDQFWLGQLQSEGLLRPEGTDAAGGARGAAGLAGGDADGGAAADSGDEDAKPGGLVWEKTDDAIQLGAAGPASNRGFHSMSRAQQNRLLEDLFPRAERPKLTSFDVDYSKKEEKSPQELELERLQERRRLRLEEWREHRHMQQMAVTFGVTTRRILDERPVRDSADRLVDEADGDLGQLFGDALERARRRQEARNQSSAGRELDLTDPRLLQPWRHPTKKRHRRPDGASTSAGGSLLSAAAVDRPVTTPATHSSGGLDDNLTDYFGPAAGQHRRQPQPPLSLTQAQHQLPQVEAKGQSTLWNNYLAAGNVRFAPLDDDQWYRAKTSTTAATTS